MTGAATGAAARSAGGYGRARRDARARGGRRGGDRGDGRGAVLGPVPIPRWPPTSSGGRATASGGSAPCAGSRPASPASAHWPDRLVGSPRQLATGRTRPTRGPRAPAVRPDPAARDARVRPTCAACRAQRRSALGRPTTPAFTGERRFLASRRGRGEVDHALGRLGGPDPLLDGLHHLEDTVPAVDTCLASISRPYLGRRLRRGAVEANVAATAGLRGGRTRLVDPDGPEPLVDPRQVHGDNPGTAEQRGGPRRRWAAVPGPCPTSGGTAMGTAVVLPRAHGPHGSHGRGGARSAHRGPLPDGARRCRRPGQGSRPNISRHPSRPLIVMSDRRLADHDCRSRQNWTARAGWPLRRTTSCPFSE